jgi:hypothetical protein
MSAKQAFIMVIGLILLALVEGIIKHFWAGFPITEVFAFQGSVAGGIITTKLINDLGEMKHGITPKAGNGNGK